MKIIGLKVTPIFLPLNQKLNYVKNKIRYATTSKR
jgi:hypothetical protein